MDLLFCSRIQISEMRRTLRPDVAPCSAEDGAPIRAERGVQREMIFSLSLSLSSSREDKCNIFIDV